MGILPWIGEHWFDLLQTVGIIGGLLFTALTVRKDERARQVIPLRSYLVITGGSAIDRSTLMGKGVGEIASRCAQLHIPCLGLAGVVAVPARQRTFAHLGALTELTSVAEARAKAPFWLRRLAHQAALGWPGA